MFEFYLVIVNYNNSKVTIDCLESAKKMTTYYFSDIVIVDNNSAIADSLILKEYIDSNKQINISLIKLQENIGYFPALNQGLIYLNLSLKRRYFVIIGNNDLLFPENFLLKLSAEKCAEDIYVIAPNIITPLGLHQNPHVIKKVSFMRKTIYRIYFSSYFLARLISYFSLVFKLQRAKKTRSNYNEECVIKMGFGACYILLPHFFNNIGLLDDSIFLMGEEALLSNQVYSSNGKILYKPNILVYHQDHSTFKNMPSKKTYYITKESFKKYKKYL